MQLWRFLVALSDPLPAGFAGGLPEGARGDAGLAAGLSLGSGAESEASAKPLRSKSPSSPPPAKSESLPGRSAPALDMVLDPIGR